MALPLEEKILFEIGLGNGPNFFNGSGTCEHIRHTIVGQLEPALRRHHEADEKIASPHPAMMNLIREAADWDAEYALTIAWQVTSDTIRTHMEAYFEPPKGQDAFFEQKAKQIKENYLTNIFRDNPAYVQRKYPDIAQMLRDRAKEVQQVQSQAPKRLSTFQKLLSFFKLR